MFIRTKKIKGQSYAYLVQNSWTSKGARQKVAKYLGKAHKVERKHEKKLSEFLSVSNLDEYVSNKAYDELIHDLIRLELHNHGTEESFELKEGSVKSKSGKEAIILANQGFICSETLKALKAYRPDSDNGYVLASLLTFAGIKADEDIFVRLFEKVKGETKPAGDFYY